MTEAIVQGISERYIELYNQITGETFVKEQTSDLASIEQSILKSLQGLQGKF
jgi:phosphoribosylaminoimidazole-succinocarboxamide synthase